ncbi:thioredoxin family protein [Flavobacteriaceae bacterium XHP0103]|uniref:thioredoxin family protein n=1 Tax=Marixanthotalea marina TaxID=2844359 RepID=UPI002989B002|nr:thioredoxin fold domain-containing protein [Marixanthotalea marina]MBU3820823.1 thioredoxin family protein [Marixanthotalea marina]
MNKVDNSSKKLARKKSNPIWKWFWLTFLVVSLAYAWYSFYVPSNDVAWANNMDSARQLSNDSGKNMLLFFTGQWCVPCRIMKREVFADGEVMETINSKVVPIMIDIDDPNMDEIVKHYQVGATPVTIFTDPQGKVIDYAVGKIDKTKFLQMLENTSVAGF